MANTIQTNVMSLIFNKA